MQSRGTRFSDTRHAILWIIGCALLTPIVKFILLFEAVLGQLQHSRSNSSNSSIGRCKIDIVSLCHESGEGFLIWLLGRQGHTVPMMVSAEENVKQPSRTVTEEDIGTTPIRTTEPTFIHEEQQAQQQHGTVEARSTPTSGAVKFLLGSLSLWWGLFLLWAVLAVTVIFPLGVSSNIQSQGRLGYFIFFLLLWGLLLPNIIVTVAVVWTISVRRAAGLDQMIVPFTRGGGAAPKLPRQEFSVVSAFERQESTSDNGGAPVAGAGGGSQVGSPAADLHQEMSGKRNSSVILTVSNSSTLTSSIAVGPNASCAVFLGTAQEGVDVGGGTNRLPRIVLVLTTLGLLFQLWFSSLLVAPCSTSVVVSDSPALSGNVTNSSNATTTTITVISRSPLNFLFSGDLPRLDQGSPEFSALFWTLISTGLLSWACEVGLRFLQYKKDLIGATSGLEWCFKSVCFIWDRCLALVAVTLFVMVQLHHKTSKESFLCPKGSNSGVGSLLEIDLNQQGAGERQTIQFFALLLLVGGSCGAPVVDSVSWFLVSLVDNLTWDVIRADESGSTSQGTSSKRVLGGSGIRMMGRSVTLTWLPIFMPGLGAGAGGLMISSLVLAKAAATQGGLGSTAAGGIALAVFGLLGCIACGAAGVVLLRTQEGEPSYVEEMQEAEKDKQRRYVAADPRRAPLPTPKLTLMTDSPTGDESPSRRLDQSSPVPTTGADPAVQGATARRGASDPFSSSTRVNETPDDDEVQSSLVALRVSGMASWLGTIWIGSLILYLCWWIGILLVNVFFHEDVATSALGDFLVLLLMPMGSTVIFALLVLIVRLTTGSSGSTDDEDLEATGELTPRQASASLTDPFSATKARRRESAPPPGMQPLIRNDDSVTKRRVSFDGTHSSAAMKPEAGKVNIIAPLPLAPLTSPMSPPPAQGEAALSQHSDPTRPLVGEEPTLPPLPQLPLTAHQQQNNPFIRLSSAATAAAPTSALLKQQQALQQQVPTFEDETWRSVSPKPKNKKTKGSKLPRTGKVAPPVAANPSRPSADDEEDPHTAGYYQIEPEDHDYSRGESLIYTTENLTSDPDGAYETSDDDVDDDEEQDLEDRESSLGVATHTTEGGTIADGASSQGNSPHQLKPGDPTGSSSGAPVTTKKKKKSKKLKKSKNTVASRYLQPAHPPMAAAGVAAANKKPTPSSTTGTKAPPTAKAATGKTFIRLGSTAQTPFLSSPASLGSRSASPLRQPAIKRDPAAGGGSSRSECPVSGSPSKTVQPLNANAPIQGPSLEELKRLPSSSAGLTGTTSAVAGHSAVPGTAAGLQPFGRKQSKLEQIYARSAIAGFPSKKSTKSPGATAAASGGNSNVSSPTLKKLAAQSGSPPAPVSKTHRKTQSSESGVGFTSDEYPQGSVTSADTAQSGSNSAIADLATHGRPALSWEQLPMPDPLEGEGHDTEDGTEGANNYTPGGYHPTQQGELFNGRYKAIRKLGWGEFSVVWLARDLRAQLEVEAAQKAAAGESTNTPNYSRHHEFVALKISKSAPKYRKAAVAEMEVAREMRSMLEAELLAENCLSATLGTFEHVGPHGSHIVMVMELCGPNLLKLMQLQDFKGLPIPVVKCVIRQVLQGAAACESIGLIHCDLKPENILFACPGEGTITSILDYQKKSTRLTRNPLYTEDRHIKVHRMGMQLMHPPIDGPLLREAVAESAFASPMSSCPASNTPTAPSSPTGASSKSERSKAAEKSKAAEVMSAIVHRHLRTFYAVRVADFGTARFEAKVLMQEQMEKMTTRPLELQTLEYRAPEIVLGFGERDLTPAMDTWSIACIAFELITGAFLFDPKAYAQDPRFLTPTAASSGKRAGQSFNMYSCHLSLYHQLLGPPPPSLLLRAQYTSKFYKDKGGTEGGNQLGGGGGVDLGSSENGSSAGDFLNNNNLQQSQQPQRFNFKGTKLQQSSLEKLLTQEYAEWFARGAGNKEGQSLDAAALREIKLFVSFLEAALAWDPQHRAKPSKLLDHRWLKLA